MTSTTSPANYPVRLTGELDQNLSRWLWLLIVGLIVADLLPYPWSSNDWSSGFQPIGGYSVLNLLVVVAGFFLLITRQYPRSLFDLLLGINRWMYRVLSYVALMRDEYPPFRLDQGAYEPGDLEPARPATTPALVRTPA